MEKKSTTEESIETQGAATRKGGRPIGRLRRCGQCLLSEHLCICSLTPSLSTKSKIIFLTHVFETRKPTNTARLVLNSVPSSECIIWDRVKPDHKLISMISGNEFLPFVVFPGGAESPTQIQERIYTSCKIPLLIFLDGTWLQGRKILKQGSYLWKLPRISINPTEESKYFLRRSREPGRLCTIEAVVAALAMIGENAPSQALDAYYLEFLRRYALIRGINRGGLRAR